MSVLRSDSTTIIKIGYSTVIQSQGNQSVEIFEQLNPNQTVWTLTAVPTNPGISKFFVNGQKQRYAIDYQINGLILQWFGYTLKSNWTIEFYYH